MTRLVRTWASTCIILLAMVCGIAPSASAQIWSHVYPSTSGVSSANDIPVGVAMGEKTALVCGTRVINNGSTLKFFQVVAHDVSTGSVVDSLTWPDPINATTDSVATAMTSFSSGNYVAVILTGTTVDYSTHRRPTTIMVDNGGTGGALRLVWSKIEDYAEIDIEVVPVGVSAYISGNPAGITHVGIASLAGSNGAFVNVYAGSNGAHAMPLQVLGSVVPIGVAMVTTSHSVGVIMGGTSPYDGADAVTLWGYQVNAPGGGGPASGDVLGGSLYRVVRNSGDVDTAKAMTTDGAHVAITGHRVNGSSQNWVTDVVNAYDDNSGTDNIVETWAAPEELDQSGRLDMPTAIVFYGVSPAEGEETVPGAVRIGVAGTTKATTSGAATDVLVAGYYLVSSGSYLEWSKQQNTRLSGYSGNESPAAIAFAAVGAEIDERLFITGTTEKLVNSVVNKDMLGMCFDARTEAIVLGADRHLWTNAYFRSGDDNEDVGIGVIAGQALISSQYDDVLYMTGTTYNATYAKDWYDLRVEPIQP